MNGSTSAKPSPVLAIIVAALAVAAAIILVALPFMSQLALPSGPGPIMDPNFRIPALPVDSPYLPGATQVITWLNLALAIACILYAIPDAMKRNSAVPVVLAMSGFGIAVPEVFVDVMGCVWYATSPDNNAYTLWGRQMPWFIVAAWGMSGGFFSYVFYRQFRSGASDKKLWLIFWAVGFGTMLLEEPLLHFGQYYYYGNQPLILVAKYPYWWMVCNTGGMFLAGALAYRLESQLQGWRSLAVLLLTPMSVAGVYAFIAMPAWIAVNGNYGRLVTHAAGLLTILMGILAVALVIQLVVRGAEQPAVGTSPS